MELVPIIKHVVYFYEFFMRCSFSIWFKNASKPFAKCMANNALLNTLKCTG